MLFRSPDPEAGRPADPGQEVDQGAAIGPKVRQTAALMAPLYLKRPRPATENSDGFRPLRTAPDDARKAARVRDLSAYVSNLSVSLLLAL